MFLALYPDRVRQQQAARGKAAHSESKSRAAATPAPYTKAGFGSDTFHAMRVPPSLERLERYHLGSETAA